MKLLHISDLHIGRRLGGLSLMEDQRYILEQILTIADVEKPDCMMIAGDIYDKSLPSAEAVELFDDFLTALAGRGFPVFLVSGNHDSPERLNYGSRLLNKDGIVIAGTFGGEVKKTELSDKFGKVCFYLLPYIKPATVRPYFGDGIETYDDAVRAVLSAAEIDPGNRNVLIAHQFVTSFGRAPEVCDSESLSVGGLDNVDVSAFDAFEYVALGHIHGPQRIGRDTVRYAGSPLKYSFSEARHHKSVTIAELGPKGETELRLIPLNPRRELREIRGPIKELLRAGENDPASREDYIRAVITDKGEVYDAIGRLRSVYKNLLRLDFENVRSPAEPAKTAAAGDAASRTPMELFDEFYRSQKGDGLSEEQRRLMKTVFDEAKSL